MNAFHRFLQILYSSYAILVFIILMFILFPFVLVACLLPEPHRGNLAYRIALLWSDIGMFLWGIRQKTLYRPPRKPGHAVIFVFNHVSLIDIPVLIKSLRHFRIRILGKKEMSKIPVFGVIYRAAVIMVDRSDADNRSKSVAKLKSALQQDINIVIAPEGTFNETTKPLKDFYDGAFRIALETETSIIPVVFPDNYDRLHPSGIFNFTPGITRAVFLEEIDISAYHSSEGALLKTDVYKVMEDALKHYQASWIKEN